MHKLTLLLFVLFLMACGPAAPTTAVPTATTPTTPVPPIDINAIPDVDRSQAIVPLSDIYFDTFRRYDRVVPLDEADNALILSLRDAIPPIYTPLFDTANEAPWLADDDIVLGYADGDQAYAYAIKIMNWHEIVSHEVNGRSILATY